MFMNILDVALKLVIVIVWLTALFFPAQWLARYATRQFRNRSFKPKVAWGLGRLIFWLLIMIVGVSPALSMWGVELSPGLRFALIAAIALTLLETFGKEPHAFEVATKSATPQTTLSADTHAPEDHEHGEPFEEPHTAPADPV